MKLTTVGATQLATALALAALLSSEAEASKKFVKMIPNGGNVPDTPAIGHPDGTGDDPSTNAFGDAFAEAGNKWTKELCEADTDGDGQTNGQELGDPCCEWDKDTNPVVQWTTGVSHPSDASKTSDPSLWANLCGASESTTESSSTTDASMTMEPTEANGSGSTASEPSEGSASSSTKASDESHSHSHNSDMHDSSMSSSNSSSFTTGSASTSGSSSSAVDVGSPSTSSDSSRNAIRGSSGESSAASSAHTPSTSSSSSSGPASSGASSGKSILVTAAGIVAVAMVFVA